MSSLIDPLVEEPVEVLARGFLDRPLQIVRLHRRELMFRDVMVESLPEELIAQNETEHVEDRRAPGVDVRSVAADADDRFSPQRRVRADARLLAVVHAQPELVFPGGVLLVKGVEVAGEAFIAPQMPPILAREDIARQLMREPVGGPARWQRGGA